MKKFLAVAAILFSVSLNAQWDTLNTGTNVRLNGITQDGYGGIVACGLNPNSDSGACGSLWLSGDLGNTWFEIAPETMRKNKEVWDVDFTQNQRMWSTHDSGLVVLQTVWFVTYTSISTISPYALYCGFPVNDSVFYCAGENGVAYRTLDYGLSWDTLSTGTGENINDIYFTDAANGWIVADGGYLAFTSDSGATWNFVSTPQFGFTDFMSIAYQDTVGVNPYIVGEDGAGLFSINGGLNWFSYATGTTNDIHCIRYMNTMSGIMCGENGYIYRTQNGGGSWFSDPSSEGVGLNDIMFINDTMAFICGDSGVVLRSRMDISAVHEFSTPSLAGAVYPNPTNGPVSLDLLLASVSDITIDVMNITGEIIQTEYHENVSAGENRLPIDLSPQSAGIYFVRVSNGFGAVTMRVVRQ